MMNTDNRPSMASAVLPPALLARPSVRRGSVFLDLITIFRRNSSHPNRLIRQFSHSSFRKSSTTSKSISSKTRETETFLKPTTYVNDQSQEDESDESSKPMSRQVLLDKIREKKEVIGKLRCQPWNMNRKRRTLKLAQKYVAQHESRVSKTHLLKVEVKKKWRTFCRWADNVKIYLIPWEAKIKRIESHFGSVVSSYFTFLRWIVYVNLMITLIIISFIVIPEMLADAGADPNRMNRTASRKIIPQRELVHADELQVVSNFDGYLKYSPLFYGYYSNDEFIGARIRYAIPLAYFIITLFVFGYSCFAILRKMAKNARLSKLSDQKTDQYIFSWKLFSGWDYTIGNGETASNTAMAIVIKLRESIVECRVDLTKKFKPLLFMARVIANAIILAMLAFSIYTISFAVQTSETVETTGSLFTKNQVPTIIATITNVFPMIFDLIGQIERYHPRTALRAHLTRVLVLYVLNYITFIIALFEKLDKIRDDELMKIINEQNAMFHYDNQQHSISSSKFQSRNFANIMQANTFAETSLKRFSNLYQQQSSEIGEEMRRKRQIPYTKKPFKLPTGITVESHYGPIGLNNPSAMLANKTYPWDQRRFQAIRIGPPSLPTFPIRPLPPNPTLNTSILTELGPHWQLRSKWQPPKTMILTTIATTTTTNQTSSQSLSKMITKTTRIPWSSKRRSKLIKKITKMELDVTSTKSTIASMNTSAMASTVFEELTQRNVEISEDTIKDDKIRADKIIDTTRASDVIASSITDNNTTLVITEDRMTEGISERKILSNGSKILSVNDGYFKVPDNAFNNETFYQIGQKAHIIANDAEIGTNFCWETMVGQEIAKLVTMDLVITIASIFIIDFFRDLWIKYLNSWWCWNMETTFPEYGEFKVAENVLHIINNQGMVWLGLFFAPLLPALNNIKLIILMYIRGWACMTCNVPAREIFRASRSSNFYLMVLLLWLLLCTLPVGYVIASKKPSSSCGPFADYARFYYVLTQMLEGRLDRKVIGWLKYIASPGVVIPVLLLLMLIIYFLVSLVRGLRKRNSDLQQQLIHERTEEKKKIFELAGTAHRKVSRNNREKKKQVTYLPLVEQKRREPWRYYNGQDLDSSLCVTDETSTITSPDSGQSSSPKHFKRRQLLPQATIQKESVEVPESAQQKIIEENTDDHAAYHTENIAQKSTADQNSIEKKHSNKLSSPSSISNITDRKNEWFKSDDEEDGELQSYNVESDVVEEATSEEIRLIDNSFPNTSLLTQSSQQESKTREAIPFSNESYVSPTHQSLSTGEIRISPSQLHSPSIISKAGSDTSQITFNAESQISRVTDTQTKKSKTNRLRTNSNKDIKHEFVPRRSMKEVQPQVSGFPQLQQKSEADVSGGHLSKITSSDLPCMKTKQNPPTSHHCQRRFRISVSPSRRFQTQSGPSGSDTDTSTGKRRYVIKQEILPDSTVSIDMGDIGTSQYRKL